MKIRFVLNIGWYDAVFYAEPWYDGVIHISADKTAWMISKERTEAGP